MTKHSVRYRARRQPARRRRKMKEIGRRLDAFGALHRLRVAAAEQKAGTEDR